MIRRVVISALLLLAGVLIWVSASYKAKPSSPSLTDAAVEALTPENDTDALRQSEVGIDLASGWDADLLINGQPIPQDEERNVEGQYQVLFAPGDGKVLETLPAGLVQVTAIIWRPTEGQTRESGSRIVRWSFRVA